MSPYLITGVIAGVLGIALGAGGMHTLDATKLSHEQAAHATDNETNAKKLQAISDAAATAASEAVAKQNDAAAKLAALDAQFTQEKTAHEADNAKNRAAVADGTRRLRVAVANFTASGSGAASTGTGASGLGDGSSGVAELAPAFGAALFGIVDDADSDGRAKAEYLQQYVCALQREGLIAGSCSQ